MSGDSFPGASASAVILTSSAAPGVIGFAPTGFAPLTTGERLAGTGRFLAAYFADVLACALVSLGTGRLLSWNGPDPIVFARGTVSVRTNAWNLPLDAAAAMGKDLA